MHQSQRHAGVRGMQQRSLPFNQHDIRLGGRFEREALSSTSNEIRYDGIDTDAATFNQDAGLTRRGEVDPMPQVSHDRAVRGLGCSTHRR